MFNLPRRVLCLAMGMGVLVAPALAQTQTFSTNLSGSSVAAEIAVESTETLDTAATAACDSSTVSVTRTNGTVLSLGNGASASAIQFIRFTPKTRFVTAASTLTISAGTGTGSVTIYGHLLASGAAEFLVVNNSSNTMAVAGGLGGTVVQGPITLGTGPTAGALVPIQTWTMTAGTWDTSGGTALQSNQDCWIDQLQLANKTAGAITVTVTDGQSTPLNTLTAVSIGANTTSLVVWPGGRFFESGMQINAGTANSIDASFRGRRARNSPTVP